jgi:hypothetical protein
MIAYHSILFEYCNFRPIEYNYDSLLMLTNLKKHFSFFKSELGNILKTIRILLSTLIHIFKVMWFLKYWFMWIILLLYDKYFQFFCSEIISFFC